MVPHHRDSTCEPRFPVLTPCRRPLNCDKGSLSAREGEGTRRLMECQGKKGLT
jgi:hypothetical protein